MGNGVSFVEVGLSFVWLKYDNNNEQRHRNVI